MFVLLKRSRKSSCIRSSLAACQIGWSDCLQILLSFRGCVSVTESGMWRKLQFIFFVCLCTPFVFFFLLQTRWSLAHSVCSFLFCSFICFLCLVWHDYRTSYLYSKYWTDFVFPTASANCKVKELDTRGKPLFVLQKTHDHDKLKNQKSNWKLYYSRSAVYQCSRGFGRNVSSCLLASFVSFWLWSCQPVSLLFFFSRYWNFASLFFTYPLCQVQLRGLT